MNILIIEDEKRAANRLEKLVKTLNPDTEVLDKLESVQKSVSWFQQNKSPDLVFMDIQLADGLSFEIFDAVKVDAPIIFTTAYDEYALRAFKVNSIDYLLKPFDADDLKKAMSKLELLSQKNEQINTIDQIKEAMKMLTNNYKERFMVKIGEHIKTIAVSDIDYFFSWEKASYCHTRHDKTYLLDYPLEEIEGMIDPEKFFRINRKFIISMAAIKDIISYSNSRLKIIFHQPVADEVIVSRDRVSDFKQWLDR
ncbi:MAG: LytTR family DNA-binding domain-containing protein [Fulvivirga sp.]|nr:LytTR family DNA-binding domain-containing protein [Fulvivirga sp.]